MNENQGEKVELTNEGGKLKVDGEEVSEEGDPDLNEEDKQYRESVMNDLYNSMSSDEEKDKEEQNEDIKKEVEEF